MSKEFKSGDLVTFHDSGKYEIVKRDAKRYTIYTIIDIDRGQGWCELTQTYKGVIQPCAGDVPRSLGLPP